MKKKESPVYINQEAVQLNENEEKPTTDKSLQVLDVFLSERNL